MDVVVYIDSIPFKLVPTGDLTFEDVIQKSVEAKRPQRLSEMREETFTAPLTVDDLQAAAKNAARRSKDHTETIKALIAEASGGGKVPDVPQEKYAALIEKLNALQ